MTITEDGVTREEFVVRAEVTNVGRSTARGHYAVACGKLIGFSVTLKPGESAALPDPIFIPATETSFIVRVFYDTPLGSQLVAHFEVSIAKKRTSAGRAIAVVKTHRIERGKPKKKRQP